MQRKGKKRTKTLTGVQKGHANKKKENQKSLTLLVEIKKTICFYTV